jgi:hypothetical protein
MVASSGPGVLTQRITQGSAADAAGLEPGDVILGLNGQGASSPYEVAQMVRQMAAGQTATVEFWRDGRSNQVQIVLQPVRERYDVGFRGYDSMNDIRRTSGDLESRVMRLEQQLAIVVQEMRQLRQLQQNRSDAATAAGIANPTTSTGLDAATESISPGTTNTSGTATAQPDGTTPPATGATQPAIEPATTPTTPPPAAEPATNEDDLFGDDTTTEAPAATATEPATTEGAAPPADDATPADTAPATESTSDDLLE